MRVYTAGPMSGLPLLNFPAFFDAERRLSNKGHAVVNPARHDEVMGWVTVTRDEFGGILDVQRNDGTFSWADALDWDLEEIAECDAIYLLPGWGQSRGATKELEYATALDLRILGATDEVPVRAGRRVLEPLVGLIGYAQAGKDTLAATLVAKGWTRLAFADPLKALAVAAGPRFNVGVEGGHLHTLGTIVNGFGWEMAKADVPGVREYLQDLGVGVRDVLGSDTWVRAAFAGFDPSQPTVFTDVRFPNEVEAIRDRGGAIMRVTRLGLEPPNNHVSEQLVREIEPDYEVIAPYEGREFLAQEAEWLDNELRGGR